MKKIIIITGGSSGIGLQLVNYYLKKNNTVYTTYLKSKNELIKLKRKYEKNLFFKKMDLGSVKDIKNFSKIIKENSNLIDIIVLNALNKVKRKKFSKVKKKEIIESLNKNFLGNFFFLQILSKKVLFNQKLKILHISSIVSKKGSWGLSVYGPVKAAVDNLFKCLQYEFKNNIKFKSVYLSAIDTKGYRYTNGTRNIYKTIKVKQAIPKIVRI